MTLRFCALGSGSRGNALLVESSDTLLLVDCGLSRTQIEQRMGDAGRSASDIDAILVTHEHGDHSRGIGSFTSRYGVPVWMTPGTASVVERPQSLELLNCHQPLTIGSIEVVPFPVPHDAREPCQFVFESAGRRLGLLTDTGHVTSHICRTLEQCDALALEFNHDVERLDAGPYPPSVKTRVGSNYGHLNNAQSAGLLAKIDHPGLQQVVGMHISEQNNTAELVHRSIEAVSDRASFEFELASQDAPTGWFEIE